jgi:hypothetical protein
MTPQMHAQLASLYRLFLSGEISDEEWALLQIHLAYCDDCCRTFLESQQISTSVVPTCSCVLYQGRHALLGSTENTIASVMEQ